jgi:Conserved hypothetical protein 2217 (DUF2460)
MATFPKLKTGAVAQYPATRSPRFQNRMLRFIDGADQRYRDSAGVLHQWEIHLDDLDEREMAAVEGFFSDNQGCFGNFAFTDPWDGQTYPNCSFAADELDLISLMEMRGRASLKVIENRG